MNQSNQSHQNRLIIFLHSYLKEKVPKNRPIDNIYSPIIALIGPVIKNKFNQPNAADFFS